MKQRTYLSRRRVSVRSLRKWRLRGTLHERGTGLAVASRGTGVVIMPRRS